MILAAHRDEKNAQKVPSISSNLNFDMIQSLDSIQLTVDCPLGDVYGCFTCAILQRKGLNLTFRKGNRGAFASWAFENETVQSSLKGELFNFALLHPGGYYMDFWFPFRFIPGPIPSFKDNYNPEG